MFVQVRLLEGFTKSLWYTVPQPYTEQCVTGTIIQVPLRKRVVPAVIEYVTKKNPSMPFELRAISCFEKMPSDSKYTKFIKQLAEYYQIDYIILLKRLRQFVKQHEKRKQYVKEYSQNRQNVYTDIQLTQEQQLIVNDLLPKIHTPQYTPFLLHGVTGSGKTEIYKRLIIEAITSKLSVILLLPEVTLAVQFETLLRTQLPHDITLYGFHSAASIKQKRQLWEALVAGKSVFIIGVHLPILLPIANLGCIIVDEEHEVGYQEKKHPKINSKQAAILRAHIANIPIILGSGTPSVASLYNVTSKNWSYGRLTKRFAGAFPKIEIVSLSDKKVRRNFWISTKLEQAIKHQLQRNEQTIIFLNRRGYSFFVQCKQCSFIVMCSNCSVSLTLHENNTLTCHYCSIQRSLPSLCSECKASDNPFLKKGIGTQQVVTILQKRFPQAHIVRADLDTTVNKKRWQQTIYEMQTGTIDILVGTQTITKGYHFPKVTLVGILWADLNLHFPLYNAAETTLQQLIQVAGRAGRASEHSKVIVQTMIDHPIYEYLAEHSYQQFYKYELEKRKKLNYPPYMRFAEIELKNTNEKNLDNDAECLALLLAEQAKKYNVLVLGPAKPPVAKVKNIHMRKIYLKASSMCNINTVYQFALQQPFTSQIFFTPNPLT